MNGTIYALAEPGTGDIRYCGKTIQPLSCRLSGHRADIHRQSHRHLYRWLKKLYDAGQEPEVMVCEELDLAGLERNEQLLRLNEAETRWISQFKALGFRLTNATTGGDGCHGRTVSEATRTKTAASNRGKKRSAEYCERLRQAALMRPKECYLRGEAHPHFGKTQNWKDPKARAAKIKESWSDQRRLAMGATHLGEKNVNAKITAEIALQIYADDRPYRMIAADFGVSIPVVSNIKNGITWKHATKHDHLRRKRTKFKINAEIAREVYLANGSQAEIATRFNLDQSTVSNIKTGKRWKRVTQHLN